MTDFDARRSIIELLEEYDYAKKEHGYKNTYKIIYECLKTLS